MRRILSMTPERRKMLAHWMLIDSACVIAAFFAALSIATRAPARVFSSPDSYGAVVLIAALTVACSWTMRLYAVQARYVGFQEAKRLGALCLVSMAIFSLTTPLWSRSSSVDALLAISLYGLVVSFGLCSVRIWLRSADYRRVREMRARGQMELSRALLIGAGDAGEMLIREFQRSESCSYVVVGIVDDDPKKSFTLIHGVPVLGTTRDIPTIVEKYRVNEILLAIPSADGARMREIVAICARVGVKTRTLPGVTDLIANKTVVKQIREVDITDLLRRKPVQPDTQAGVGYVRGKVVLITGGGGSIGGELARQVARMGPTKLILVGKGENSIFEVEQQIRLEDLPAPVPIIADVRDLASMEAVFEQHRPDVVFHAAAHKHVPLMEGNPIEAVRNNVGGTLNVVQLAIRHEAAKFILVSTDKAVRPQSVMGATKRVAEKIVCAHAEQGSTDCAVVRFGNVLGSRGSLVPLLKAQIARGGPVQVTHPDMTRYFMTIPEAVHLIVQAGAFGRNGEIFILDMGEPIKILDLAEDVIRLHGFEPNKTMPIVFTGPRPGEKLHEELTCDLEELKVTPHPKIRFVESGNETWDILRQSVDRLMTLCAERQDEPVRRYLLEVAQERVLPAFDLGLADLSHRANGRPVKMDMLKDAL